MPAVTKPSSSKNSNSEKDLETWIEKIVDGKDGSVPKQVFLGGASGWLTGFLAMKVGKFAALSIGGGIILLQVANHQGYININWNRLNRDVEDLSKKIQTEGKSKDWSDKILSMARENTYASAGFAAGFLIGMASS